MEKEKTDFTEITDIEVVGQDGEVVESDLVIVLRMPYTFEGETFTKIDLTGLEDLKGGDMIAVSKIMERQGVVTPLPEMHLGYAFQYASRVTGYPVEFFTNLPAKESTKVKNRVSGFFFGVD